MLDSESAATIYAPAFVQLSKSPVIPMPVHGSAWDTEGYAKLFHSFHAEPMYLLLYAP